MNVRKTNILLFLIFLLSCSVIYGKSFSIENATIKYVINSDGRVHVVENIKYVLSCDYDRFHELYRELPKGLPFDNASGYCIGDNCTFRYDPPEYSLSGNPELILELNKGCGNVTVHFEYDVYTLIKHKDTVQFYYKLWGEKSPKVGYLDIYVVLPQKGNVTYFIHPWDVNVNSYHVDNTVEINGENYPAQTFLEINLLMPLEWFENTSNFIKGTSTKEEIINNENIDKIINLVVQIITIIVFLMIIAAIVFPWAWGVFCYIKYGRELSPSQVGYHALYEREPPSEHSPVEAPLLAAGDYDTKHALQAAIVLLAAKNWITILKKDENYILQLNQKGDKIKPIEKEVYDMLLSYSKDLKLDLTEFKKKVTPTKKFYEWHEKWVKKIEDSLNLEQYIDYTGYEKFKEKVVSLSIYSLIIFAFLSYGWLDKILNLLFLFIVTLGVVAAVQRHLNKDKSKILRDFLLFFIILFVIYVISPNFIPTELRERLLFFSATSFISSTLAYGVFTYKKVWLSRWNKEGRLLNLKWQNFKRYLSDYSLLKQHPPKSVVLWKEYLAYAVGFGVAEATIRAMEKINPQFIEQTDTFNTFAYAYTYSVFTPTYTPPSRYSSSRSSGGWSGGFSGSGGGFGGGGFGAR